MSNFKQDYNLSETQKDNEKKQVNSLIRWWAVCVFISVGIAGYFVAIMEINALPYPSGIVLCLLDITAALAAVAQHIIAIVGKVDYRTNSAMNTVFIIDMVLLGITVVSLIALVSLTKACNDCG
ncbi:MAG: hypothetical protein IJ872_03375 [Eubacterium sp.]|nr:hypothetical protein [Eubacterium sp.]